MNNVKTREEILILRQNELIARNNYNAALTEYIEALSCEKTIPDSLKRFGRDRVSYLGVSKNNVAISDCRCRYICF